MGSGDGEAGKEDGGEHGEGSRWMIVGEQMYSVFTIDHLRRCVEIFDAFGVCG